MTCRRGCVQDVLTSGTRVGPPKTWAAGDRLLFWEAAPKLRVAGLGVLTALPEARRDGDVTFHVQYLTRHIRLSPTLAELKQDPVIQTAAFVKSGAAGTVFPVSDDQLRRSISFWSPLRF
jgi:hypothetical protein